MSCFCKGNHSEWKTDEKSCLLDPSCIFQNYLLSKNVFFFHFGAFLGRSCHVAFCRLLECDESLFVGFPKSVNPFTGTFLPKPTFWGGFSCVMVRKGGVIIPSFRLWGDGVKQKNTFYGVHHPKTCRCSSSQMLQHSSSNEICKKDDRSTYPRP